MITGIIENTVHPKKVCILANGCPESRLDCARIQEFFTRNHWNATNNFRKAD